MLWMYVLAEGEKWQPFPWPEDDDIRREGTCSLLPQFWAYFCCFLASTQPASVRRQTPRLGFSINPS
jgi:hypothetical protein